MKEFYDLTIAFLTELDCRHFEGLLTIEECAELLVYGYVCQ